MPEPNLIALFVRPLARLQTRYLVSGSVAAMLYGEPRLTHDIDLVVFLRDEDLRRLPEAFPPAQFYLPPVEVMAAEAAREQRGHFNAIHMLTGLKADFYTAGRDELHGWAFRHVREFAFEGETIRLAPPEYVIIRKLEYLREGGSEKHLRDIRSMLAVSGDSFDLAELQDWIRRRGLEPEWQRVQD